MDFDLNRLAKAVSPKGEIKFFVGSRALREFLLENKDWRGIVPR